MKLKSTETKPSIAFCRGMISKVNSHNLGIRGTVMTLSQLANHYQQRELTADLKACRHLWLSMVGSRWFRTHHEWECIHIVYVQRIRLETWIVKEAPRQFSVCPCEDSH